MVAVEPGGSDRVESPWAWHAGFVTGKEEVMTSKRLMVTLGAMALFLILAWVMWPSDPAPVAAGADRGARGGSQVVAVETAAVEQRSITDVGLYTGTLQSGSQFMLAPKAGGRLRSLLVDIGDQVEQGQVIAQLDDEEFQQAVAEQRAAVEVAQAQLEDTEAQREVRRRSYDRVADLRRRNLASESEYDLARSERDAAVANVRVAQAQLAQREAALRGAEVRLSYTRVRAEWNGGSEASVRYVGERFVDEGANVSANEPIISVIDLDALRAVTFVTDRDFARLRVGQRTRVRSDARPGEEFEGRVVRIAPLLREDSRQARVEIRIENEARRLSPGFFVSVEVDVEQIDDALVVPRDAITRHGGQVGVFLLEDDFEGNEADVRWVPVVKGVRTNEYVQILEPAISGRVVTLGQHRLSDGSRVRVTALGNFAG